MADYIPPSCSGCFKLIEFLGVWHRVNDDTGLSNNDSLCRNCANKQSDGTCLHINFPNTGRTGHHWPYPPNYMWAQEIVNADFHQDVPCLARLQQACHDVISGQDLSCVRTRLSTELMALGKLWNYKHVRNATVYDQYYCRYYFNYTLFSLGDISLMMFVVAVLQYICDHIIIGLSACTLHYFDDVFKMSPVEAQHLEKCINEVFNEERRKNKWIEKNSALSLLAKMLSI